MSLVLVDRPVPEVAVVTLNRPERMNAMAFDVMVPFRDALRELGDDNAVRAVVLTGAGTGFCSGADQESAGTPPGAVGVTRRATSPCAPIGPPIASRFKGVASPQFRLCAACTSR
jgi:enoyl-CoA hydratase